MKIAIEIFVSLFILIMVVGICIGLVSSDLGVMEARDFYYSCVNELQQSNFADNVMSDCITRATVNGYALNIDILETPEGDRSAVVSLKYLYGLPVLGITQQKYIEGYVT